MGPFGYANIGLGVFVAILLPGALLLRNAGDGPLQALFLFALVVGFIVYHGLDERAKRRAKRDQ